MTKAVTRAFVLSLFSLIAPIGLAIGSAQELDFEFIAPTTGSLSYNGQPTGTLLGSAIDVDLVVGLNTPANNNVGRVCVSCTFSFTSGAFSSSTATNWTFAAGGTVTLTGGVDLDNDGFIGAGDIPLGTTLFQGTFDNPVTVTVVAGGFRVLGGSFSNTMTSALSSFFGLPTGAALYSSGLNLSFSSSTAPPSGFSSTQLFSGNMANSAPAATPTPSDTPTNTPTDTPTSSPTSTATNSPTDTATATPSNTATPSPTQTSTAVPTNTATPSPTRTPTATASQTAVNTPTSTATLTSTPTLTLVPISTDTPTQTPTSTATDPPTNMPTSTPTQPRIPEQDPTSTPTGTATATPSSTSTASPTLTSTNTPTRTPTATHTLEIVEETPTPQVAIDLAIEKHFADASCSRGAPGRYSLIVHNLGEQTTPALPDVIDTLPNGVTLANASGLGWDCTMSTATMVHCVATSLFGPGESRTITLNVDIAMSAAPALVNTATVAGQIGELNLSNNTSSIMTLCVGGPTGVPVMGPMGFACAIVLLGAVAYWRLRGTFDQQS